MTLTYALVSFSSELRLFGRTNFPYQCNFFLYIGRAAPFVVIFQIFHLILIEYETRFVWIKENLIQNIWITARFILIMGLFVALISMPFSHRTRLIGGGLGVLTGCVISIQILRNFTSYALFPPVILQNLEWGGMVALTCFNLVYFRKISGRFETFYRSRLLLIFGLFFVIEIASGWVFLSNRPIMYPIHLLEAIAYYGLFQLIVEIGFKEPAKRMHHEIQVKDRFLANISHDLRTPLKSIIGFSEIIQDLPITHQNPDLAEMNRYINANSLELLNRINQILYFTQIHSDQISLQKSPTSVHSFFEIVNQRVRTGYLQKNISVTFENYSQHEMFSIDLRYFIELIVCLLQTSIEYTPVGGKIGMNARDGERTNEIIFTIWSSRVGFEFEQSDEIIQPYAISDDRHSFGWDDLQQASQKICELHGGYFEKKSHPETGTQLILHIPQNI
jgi:signal transduction histidine kinase